MCKKCEKKKYKCCKPCDPCKKCCKPYNPCDPCDPCKGPTGPRGPTGSSGSGTGSGFTGPTGLSSIGPTGDSFTGPTGESSIGPTGLGFTGPTGESSTPTVGFAAYTLTGAGLVDGENVLYDTTNVGTYANVGGVYDDTTGIFTPSFNGLYIVSHNETVQLGTSTTMDLHVEVNSSPIPATTVPLTNISSISTSTEYVSHSFVQQLSASDSVAVVASITTGGASILSGNFSAALISLN